jgi:diguanylate cyclase (GGDEF)-like protein/PAS domain S-box-containing protein
MKPVTPMASPRADEEIFALIETLHLTGQRLEQLTSGEVDAVADREGRTFLLRHVQEQLRHTEAARQAAILDALPAHIALLNARGSIISVNQGWRAFASANALQGPQYAIGVNYLEICDNARGDDAAEAKQAAAAIRSVLAGAAPGFSVEYPCHSPTQQRWFLMKVTPLADELPHGVVVMHLDISEQRRAEEVQRRFVAAMDAIADGIFLTDRTTMTYLHVNDAACRQQNLTREALLALGPMRLLGKSRAEVEREYDAVIGSGVAAEPFELLWSRADGSPFWVELRRHAQWSGERWTIVTLVRDITERKRYEHEILATKTRLQGMLDAIPDLLFELGLDGRYYACHSPRTDLLAAPAEELLGRTVAEVLPVDAAEIVLSALHEANTTGHSAGKQFKLVLPQGSLWFELSVARMAIDHEREPRFICLSRDITERKQAELELRESEARFRSLTALSTDWYWQQDETLRFVTFSGGDHVAGWGADQLGWVGLRRWDIPGIAPLNGDWQEHKALLEARKPFRNFEYQRRDGDGSIRYVAASGEPIFDAGGGFAGYRGVATDITARKAAEIRITRLNRVHAVLSGINTLIVRVRDRDELFREACLVAVEAGGFRLAWIGLVDRDTMELIPVASAGSTLDSGTLVNQRFSLLEDAPPGNALSACAIREKKAAYTNDVPNDPRVVFKAEHAQRGSRSMAILPLLVADESVGVLALYAEEIGFFDEAELKLLTELAGDIGFAIDHIGKEARLNYLAYYDPLTGLANRSLFLDRVAQHLRDALAGGHQLAMFLIDLERFKNINDSLGRPAGDALLRQVAEWLTSHVEDASLVARVGADHFVVVLPKVTQDCDVAHDLETTMAALVDHPFRLSDSIFRIAARVGVALFPDDGADAETLFRNAEAALKLAKARGERYLFYTRTMTATGAAKLGLENQLRQALDNEEFVLHYQPKVSLTSGKMTSAEALIRWNDPRTGLVAPGRFIPILEETGLIYEVGRWALRQAIADYLRWRAAGLPAVRIAVNVSPLQLRNRGFIDEIEHAITIDPQAAAGLELEITESLIMEDVKHSIASLQAIRAMGISIAIDDFGTGFSSLSYLARLPVDTLKIDRSFVIDMTLAPEGLALVSTIISLAHSLKLKVVAEGVETEEQSRLLRLLDCDEMQGFLFSKPLPGEVFEARYLTQPAAAAT